MFHFCMLIISSQTIEMNSIRDLSMQNMHEYAEMGIKPNRAHTGVQDPELRVSEVVFASDNHNKNNRKIYYVWEQILFLVPLLAL